MRAIAGHEFVVATPTDPYSSDGLSLRFSGSEGDPVAIKADAFYEGGVALSSKYLQANQSISLTGAVTGSGTTSIATTFANTHLAGINQDLTTTSSPTFASATIGNGIYRAYAGANPSLGAIYASGVAPGALNYVLAWESNGNTSYLSGIVASYLCVNGAPVITATSSGASVAGTLTASGLITANGGISGNLTGHASLDIPLTGSSAIAGSFAPATNQYYDFGAPSYQWNNVMAKTFVENGTSLSGLYASLNNDNTLVGQNDFAGRTITDGNLLVRATFSTGFSVWSTNTARTLDIANTNVHIYNVVTNTQQTLPNGLYNGQVIFFKNNTQSGIVPVGSINSSSMPIEPLSTVMLVWDANNTRWF